MQTRYLVLTIVVVANLSLGAGCWGKKPATSGATGKVQPGKTYEVDSKLCQTFDKDFMQAATGKTFAKLEPQSVAEVSTCHYYTDYKADYFPARGSSGPQPGGPHIALDMDNSDPQSLKATITRMGGTSKTDSRIPMDHFILLEPKGTVWKIVLVLGTNKYLAVSQLLNVLSDDQMIDLSAKLAQKIAK
jgi:hypothetical protein